MLAVLWWIARVQTPASDSFAVEPSPFSTRWLQEPVERNRFLRLPRVDSHLDAIAFTSDGQHGWAVGDAGTILGTRDGGNSWQPQTSGAEKSLFAVTFASDGQLGWAVGLGGTILSTHDGGNSWQPQSSGTEMWLYSVTFASDGQLGWAVGWGGTILSTRDGGNSWQPRTSGSKIPLAAVAFARDGLRGWAVGVDGTILSTRDGGNSWLAQTSGSMSTLRAVTFTSGGQLGWAVGDAGAILSTRDSGNSWQAQTSGAKSWLFAATFARDGQRGWTVAGAGAILSTRDGGRSWQTQNSGSMTTLHAVTFTSDGRRGWAVGEEGTILGTQDGGDSWQAQNSGSMSTLTAVTFTTDGQRGWAVGVDGTILSTRDGGNSWLAQTSGAMSWLHAVTFTSDGQRGWAVGDGGTILSTRNGGNSWQAQITGSTRTLMAVTFTSDGQRGWAVGEGGTILSTHDFGNSWQAQISGSASTLMAVTFTGDGQRGWAVGFTGTILSTYDFGNSWQRQTSGSVSRLTAVTFTSDGQRGWVVGFSGTILSTRDGGGTWVAATYARYPAPWFYGAAWLVLAAAIVAGVRFHRRRGERVLSVENEEASDEPTGAAEEARPGAQSGLGEISVVHTNGLGTTIAGSPTPAAGNPTAVGVGDVVGNYRLEEKLGEGAMGVVFRAQHCEVHNQRVAIKFLNPTRPISPPELERFRTEAESIARVVHPNVVRLFDFNHLPSGHCYIVMEYLPGESLDARSRQRPLALSEVLHVGMQAADALSAAHRANIVHRDIKPQNIFIAPTATDPLFAKVVDFGVAKLRGLEDSQPSMTLPGTLLGTPLYMSPEQCEGRTDVDGRADVYSLGVVLFELLAERPPFQGNNAELIRQHISVLPPSLCSLVPTCPSSLGAIIDRALAKDPNGRFQTMQDLRAALAAEKDRLSRGEDPLAVAPTLDAASSPHPQSPESGAKPVGQNAGSDSADLPLLADKPTDPASGLSLLAGTTHEMSTTGRRFDVALSFPGERREFVEQVAGHLAHAFGKERVLYDKYHQAEFARPDLDVYLPDLYRTQSELTVVFLCAEYASKRWCRLEWRHVRQLIATADAKRIMFVSFGAPGDVTELGICGGDGYIDIGSSSAEWIAEKIRERLRLNQGIVRPATKIDSTTAIGGSMDKRDASQEYAAIPAGARAWAVLEKPPSVVGPQNAKVLQTSSGSSTAVLERDLLGLASALLEAGAPPSVITLMSDASSDAKQALDQLGTVRRTITSADGKQTMALSDMFLAQQRHHILVAPPGSGKTHTLWRNACDLFASGKLIPIYLPVGIAQTWTQVLAMVADAPQRLDPGDVLRDSRVCVILDGWTEFSARADTLDSAAALRTLHSARVVASGRKCPDQAAAFNIWSLDPLPTSAVAAAIRTALPNPPQIEPGLAEFLRLPLALSLYLLLGGSARSRGELLALFHRRLSRGLPDAVLPVLSGAVSAVSLSPTGSSWARLEEEMRQRASSESIGDPRLLLERLGTLQSRTGMVVPIHDLYWRWLSGVGILGEDRVSAALPFLPTRESIDLALESGVQPKGPAVGIALDIDILAAAQMSAHLPTDDPVLPDVATAISKMLVDQSMATRVRGAMAALKSRNVRFLVQALNVVTAVRNSGVYEAAFEGCLNLDWLFMNRGVVAEWVGALGTDQLLKVIADRGDQRWGDWLAQMAIARKVSFPDAVGVALACQGDIPPWAAEHLFPFIQQESYRLRAVAARGKNREIARWLADHYVECVDLHQSAFFDINQVLVACADDSTFECLLDRFLILPAKAQELLGFAVKAKGDPWLGRFQQVAFRGNASSPHHQLLDAVSEAVDDATARAWIESGPAVLGWRVLIARHGNSIVPELLQHLPPSFEGLHVIPALEAMEYLKEAPDALTDEIWARVRGRMQPRATAAVLLALAAIRNTGVASVVRRLAQNPFFLPAYHLVLFLRLLRKWESETGLRINVRSTDGRDLGFIEWLLSLWLPRNINDPILESMLPQIRDVAVPALLACFDSNKDAAAKLIVRCGGLDRYNEKLVQHLLLEATGPKVICERFSSILDTFPEPVLLRLLDADVLDFQIFVRALASSSSPIHRTLHAKLIHRTLEAPFNEWMYRYVARILSVHPRGSLLGLLKEHLTPTVAGDLWFIREIERASGQLLIKENGEWLS